MDFSRFPRKALPKDETLFFEEEDSRELYVLLTGSLGVFRDEVQVATIDQPMSLVGEISALTGAPRNATVRALRLSTLVAVDNPEQLFGEYPQLGAKLARLLAERLSEMNAKFVELKSLASRSREQRPEALADPGTGPALGSAETLVAPKPGAPGPRASRSRPSAAARKAPATPPKLSALPGDPGYVDDVMSALDSILDFELNAT